MKLKKAISVLLALCLSLLIFPQSIIAKETEFGVISSFLSKYFKAVQLYEENDILEMIEVQTYSEYLDKKIETLQLKQIQPTFDKVNYKLNFELLELEEAEHAHVYSVVVEESFNYADMLDLDSNSTSLVQVTINPSTQKILTANFEDEYDLEMYSFAAELNSDIATNAAKLNLAEKQNNLYDKYEEFYRALFTNPEGALYIANMDNENIVQPAASNSLNKSAIVTWARNNYNKTNPSSGGSGVPYYDFATISGNWDCTNFVSHALLAGGATPNTSSTGTSGWFYQSLNNRSTSWSGVAQLYTFLTRATTTTGPRATNLGMPTASSTPSYSPGDVVQFHNGSIWRHSAIIDGYYTPEGTTVSFTYTDRTSSTSRNTGKKYGDAAYTTYRILKLSVNVP